MPKKSPEKKKNIEIIERVYNTCLSYGFTPWDDNAPYAPGSAIVQCARLTQQKREKINDYLREGLIVEEIANYNPGNPHDLLLRSLRQAGVDLGKPQEEADAEESTATIDTKDLSEAELRAAFKKTERELLLAQRKTQTKDAALQEQQDLVKGLKAENKTLRKEVKATDTIYAELTEQFIRPVARSSYPPIVRSETEQTLIACGILSDLHITEWVAPEEVMGISAFNADIAQERLKQFTEGFIKTSDDHATPKTTYQGAVLNIAGDIISGMIHPELVSSNRTRTMTDRFGQQGSYPASCFDAAFEATEMLIPVITALRDHFGVVKVPLVVGNHGRNGEKFTFKGHVHNSFDYLVGKLLEKHFAKDPQVEIITSESTDLIYDIYTSRFLLTHGDRMGVKGGDGFIGSIGPIMRGNKKMRDHLSNYGITYNYTLMGHWHQYQAHSNLVVNGSLVGPSAHSNDSRFSPEPPQQSLFMVHPTRGILYHHPIVCDHMYRIPRTDPLIPQIPTKPDFENPFQARLGQQSPAVIDLSTLKPKRGAQKSSTPKNGSGVGLN